MQLCRTLLSGLLFTVSFVSLANDGIYYSELKFLKESPSTQGLFDQDLGGGSWTNQCNIESYRPSLLANEQQLAFFAHLDMTRKALSLGNMQRRIVEGKNLSFIRCLLQAGLSYDSDLVIITSETMPALYNYIDSLAQKADIKTPVVFMSLKEGFFKSFSRKILGFTGSIVIGQQLIQDLSDEELEAVIAREIGHIKCHHFNKQCLIHVAVTVGLISLSLKDLNLQDSVGNMEVNMKSIMYLGLLNNKLIGLFMLPALTSLFTNKKFEKQADIFACEVAEKSNGLINFYERLGQRDQLHAEEFDKISDLLRENGGDMPILHYIGLLISYYMAKAEHGVAKAYNKLAYPSVQERIEAAKKYMQQEA